MYCPQCGALNADSSAFCFKCGGALAKEAIAAGELHAELFAGFWTRVGGYVIDYVVLMGMVFLIFLLASVVGRSKVQIAFIYLLLGVVGPWLYSALFESGTWQATLGKKAVGVKVTDLAGQRISFGRASGRYFAQWLSNITFGIGYLMAAFTQRRQTLHDMIASTVVVYSNIEPTAVSSGPVARPVPAWAVALIVLGGMIPMLGILAAIAIPAYQDFTIRSQVSEGLILASSIKTIVADYMAETGDWPVDLDAAKLGSVAYEVETSGRYVESIDVKDGTITVTYGIAANSSINGLTLSLQPLIDEAGDIVWVCGNAVHPQHTYVNSAGAMGVGTDSDSGTTGLPDKYMPAACRSGFGGT